MPCFLSFCLTFSLFSDISTIKGAGPHPPKQPTVDPPLKITSGHFCLASLSYCALLDCVCVCAWINIPSHAPKQHSAFAVTIKQIVCKLLRSLRWSKHWFRCMLKAATGTMGWRERSRGFISKDAQRSGHFVCRKGKK